LLLLVILGQQLWIYMVNRRSRNREEFFRIITENATDLIALIDTKGHRLDDSPAYEKILGYAARELAETSVFEEIEEHLHNPDTNSSGCIPLAAGALPPPATQKRVSL
jgi:PAS domain-containing protein